MYSHTLVKVLVTMAVAVPVAGEAKGSQANNTLEVNWPRLGKAELSSCLRYDTLEDSRHDASVISARA